MKKLFIIAIITLICLSAFTQERGVLKDSRDGREYATVKIGTQTWMARNLSYKPKSGTAKAWGDDIKNVDRYGYLYDWTTAREACPKGWHLPTDGEWKTLELFLGMNPDEFDSTRKRAPGLGLKFKSTKGWNENGNGDNSSGFNAIPGGACLFYDNSYHFLGEYAYFWTATAEGQRDAYARVLKYDETGVDRSVFSINNSQSVRCVKD